MSDATVEYMALDDLPPATVNPKRHDMPALVASVTRWGFAAHCLLDERTGRLVAGHGRADAVRVIRDAGGPPPPRVRVLDDGRWAVPVDRGWASRNDDEARAYLLADNRLTEAGGWDDASLASELQHLLDADPDLPSIAGWDDADLAALLAEPEPPPGPAVASPKLADRFVIPPFDVLDSRSGWWRERKAQWLALGIRSEIGRAGVPKRAGAGLLNFLPSGRDSGYYLQKRRVEERLGRELPLDEFEANYYVPRKGASMSEGGTSIFDPVLAELLVRWYSPVGGLVLDPFAGGSVRGLVTAALGRTYLGVDLRADQIAANVLQIEQILPDRVNAVQYRRGDARDALADVEPSTADMVLTCPPYYGLEQYSTDPADLSTMSVRDFDAAYAQILNAAAVRLRPDRYAAVVVGEVRDTDGTLLDLPGRTVVAAARAGLKLHNTARLITPVGTVPVRAARQFVATRALGRIHQTVLVFWKGDRKAAATACGAVDVTIPDELTDPETSTD